MLTACAPKGDPKIADGIECVFLKKEYSLDEDIILDIYIGIKGNGDANQSIKYRIAITDNVEDRFGEGEGLMTLLEITDFHGGKYHYTEDDTGKVTYLYSEPFVLPPEMISKDSGYFYIGLLEISVGDNLQETIGGEMHYKFSYVIENNKIIISDVNYFG